MRTCINHIKKIHKIKRVVADQSNITIEERLIKQSSESRSRRRTMSGVSNSQCGQMNGGCDKVTGHCNDGVCNGVAGNPQNGNEKKQYETELMCVDGNWAVAHVAYRTNDCAYIFPITPSSVSS